MFDNLIDRLTKSLRKISGKGHLFHSDIQENLLEADVAPPMAKSFIDNLRKRAISQEVARALSSSQQFIKVVQEELLTLIGKANAALNLIAQPLWSNCNHWSSGVRPLLRPPTCLHP